MKYINKVTGAVIEAACELSGGNWIPLESLPVQSDQEAPKKPAPKPRAKKTKE